MLILPVAAAGAGSTGAPTPSPSAVYSASANEIGWAYTDAPRLVTVTSGGACAEHAKSLTAVARQCDTGYTGSVGCATLLGQTFFKSLDSAGADSGSALCAQLVDSLNKAIGEFRGPAGVGDEDMDCYSLGYYALVDDTDGTATVGTMNAMVAAYTSGGFQSCEVTTPTTTPSSTTTSSTTSSTQTSSTKTSTSTTTTTTPTTTQTTTPFYGAFGCSGGKLSVANSQVCDSQVDKLNAALTACDPGYAGTIGCEVSGGVQMVVDTALGCAGSVAILNAAVREFRGPAGDASTWQCLGPKVIVDLGATCATAAATVNAMVLAFDGGGFADCTVTTPTTTETTTTTGTSTLTTTPTSTVTTTVTTSPTTTAVYGGLGCVDQAWSVSYVRGASGAGCATDASLLSKVLAACGGGSTGRVRCTASGDGNHYLTFDPGAGADTAAECSNSAAALNALVDELNGPEPANVFGSNLECTDAAPYLFQEPTTSKCAQIATTLNRMVDAYVHDLLDGGISCAWTTPTSTVTTTETTRPPTMGPTVSPTRSPTTPPTLSPTTAPTLGPTTSPSTSPTLGPSLGPSMAPSGSPSIAPTSSPTLGPTTSPTRSPSIGPSVAGAVPVTDAVADHNHIHHMVHDYLEHELFFKHDVVKHQQHHHHADNVSHVDADDNASDRKHELPGPWWRAIHVPRVWL